MMFRSLAAVLFVWLLGKPTHGFGLISNPIQAENTWRMHRLQFRDEGHPTSMEISAAFHLYRSVEATCLDTQLLNIQSKSPNFSLKPVKCGWQWMTSPIACEWGWMTTPEEMPDHPRNFANVTKNVWHECTRDIAMPLDERNLPKAMSTWLRYRFVNINMNGDLPKNVKLQVGKATFLEFKGNPVTELTVDTATFSADDTMFSCGKNTKGKFECMVDFPKPLVSCHSDAMSKDCGFSGPVLTETMNITQFSQNYWDFEESLRETRGASVCS